MSNANSRTRRSSRTCRTIWKAANASSTTEAMATGRRGGLFGPRPVEEAAQVVRQEAAGEAVRDVGPRLADHQEEVVRAQFADDAGRVPADEGPRRARPAGQDRPEGDDREGRDLGSG